MEALTPSCTFAIVKFVPVELFANEYFSLCAINRNNFCPHERDHGKTKKSQLCKYMNDEYIFSSQTTVKFLLSF
jgi:hypothetical protein